MAYTYQRTEEQELLITSIQEWYAQNLDETKIRRYYEEGKGVDEEVTKSWVEAGFGMLGIDEEYGGTPTDHVTQVMVTEEISRLSGAFMPFSLNALAIHDVLEFGTPEQIKMVMDYYKKAGKPPFSLGFSEPGAGSDNMNMSAVAQEVDGKILLRGQKTWVSNGGFTDYCLVMAKDDDPSRTNNKMTWWLVPMDRPGIKFVPLHKIGNKIMPFGDVFLDDVEVTEADIVGERGKAFMQLMKNFEWERVQMVATLLGEAQAALEDAAKYALERHTFEKPIASYQMIQEKLTDMEIKVRNTRQMVYECAYRFDEGLDARLDTALLKRYGGPACDQVADEAVQIFGGLGFTTETRVGRIMLDCRGLRIGAGTDEIMVYIAGRIIPKRYAPAK